jgi:hypothetical protein
MHLHCLAARGHDTSPYPAVTRAELPADLGLLADLGVGTGGRREPSGDRGHAPVAGRRRAGGPMYQERGLRGWSGKPRSPRADPSGRQLSTTVRRSARNLSA